MVERSAKPGLYGLERLQLCALLGCLKLSVPQPGVRVPVARTAGYLHTPLHNHTRGTKAGQARIPQPSKGLAMIQRRHRHFQQFFRVAPKCDDNEHYLHLEHLGSSIGISPPDEAIRKALKLIEPVPLGSVRAII
jgi:hypothetical protein